MQLLDDEGQIENSSGPKLSRRRLLLEGASAQNHGIWIDATISAIGDDRQQASSKECADIGHLHVRVARMVRTISRMARRGGVVEWRSLIL